MTPISTITPDPETYPEWLTATGGMCRTVVLSEHTFVATGLCFRRHIDAWLVVGADALEITAVCDAPGEVGDRALGENKKEALSSGLLTMREHEEASDVIVGTAPNLVPAKATEELGASYVDTGRAVDFASKRASVAPGLSDV